MKERLVALALLGVTATAACRKTDSDADESKASAAVSAGVASAAPKPAGSVTGTGARGTPSKDSPAAGGTLEMPAVTLIEPGGTPRRVLRYAFVEGQKRNLKLVTDQKIQVGGLAEGGQDIAIAMQMAGALTVSKLQSDGTAHRTLLLDSFKLLPSPSTPPPIRQSVQSALERLDGLTLREKVTNRGFVHDIELDTPAVAPELAQLTSGLQSTAAQMVIPLPAEAVGVGAKWKADQSTRAAGVALHQTAHFTLISIKNDTIAAEYTLEQTGKPGAIKLPQMPGVEAKLSKLETKGSGKQQIDLKSLKSQGTATTTVTTVVGGVEMGAGAPQTIKTVIRANMKFELGE
jgi:hypothetical protein